MTGLHQCSRAPRESFNGFALVACTLLVAMLMVITLGLLSLSSIELRRSSREDHTATARGNARLALMEAIGQLQRTLGPDQRVSATAEILGGTVTQPHWTGAWRTTDKDGGSLLVRDDLDGGLRDQRWEQKLDRADEVLEWLVSGEGDPTQSTAENTVPLVGPGAAEGAPPAVMVPKVEVAGPSGKTTGHFAWWTGDLGVRANLSTADPRAELAADVSSPGDGGLYRVMASQAADIEMMEGGAKLEAEEIDRLASPGSVGFTSLGEEWGREHRFDFTVGSSGVLADVAGGGLKRDLTAYLEGSGSVPEADGLAGLSDDDALVGVEAGAEKSVVSSRHSLASPRFGVLRDWANSALPFNNAETPAKLPELDTSVAATSRTLSLANEAAVKLSGNRRTGLQPVLVEATNFTQWGTYLLRISSYKGSDGKEYPLQIYQLRTIMYPRVVLWNPYNVELEVDRLILMIQGNGRQEMWTSNENINQLKAPRYFRPETSWISFEGGRSTSFGGNLLNSEGYNDPYMGSYFFVVPATRFEPGECLVFSPPHAAEYDGRSVYRPGVYNLNSNVLSCEVAPDPSRCYYVSGSDLDDKDGGMDFLPKQFKYAPSGVRNQSDDTRVIVKAVGNNSTVTFESFDALPQVAVVSASLQYGSGREARISWSKYEWMPIELLPYESPRPTVVPNVRTRESIRLRWFDEHPSNKINSGPLAGTPHFDEALLANWNPRAAYSMRSPWENIAGSGGGPWFFGAYTRDLFDQAVSWQDQVPIVRDGRSHGNPFGTPQEANGRYVLFDVPRDETGVVSLAQFQHAKVSELIWHPSNAVGNSLADPRLGSGGNRGLNRTAAAGSSTASSNLGGFHESDIGWSSDNQRSKGRGDWANTGRAMLADTPANDNVVYDLSFEVNRTLWDRYYLSTGSTEAKKRFLKDPAKDPLPNGRMRLAPTTRAAVTEERLNDFHQAAYQLMLDGAFNVNSTRVEAWKALLASTRQAEFGKGSGVPFPRILAAPGGPWKSGKAADGDDAWDGYRVLTDEEIKLLAEAIVEQVKLRGPFLSLADFVNRRLAEDSTGRMGALQAAIESAGLNANHIAAYPLDNGSSLPNYKHADNIADATRMEQTLKPSSKAWGSPTYLTQADVLQVIGPALSARSDTFVIRTYGDAVDADGKIQARAWCEATVQRTPEPLDPDESGLNPKNAGEPGDFGRRIRIVSFRWLKPDEV